VSAHAQGAVLVDALFTPGEEKALEKRGRVLGGGVSLKTRTVGLLIRGDNKSQFTTSLLGAAINRRFFATVHGKKQGVATPKNDKYIELAVPTQYRHSLGRYMRVVRSVAMRETAQQRAERIGNLEMMLLQPTSSAKAALRLEAIGREALPVLKKGLAADDPEVRFYSAEALGYLDDADAVPLLAEAARGQWAFRWHALTALSVMNHVEAYDALTELLHAPSVETRYGALIALRERNPHDPLAQGEVLGDTLRLVRIPSQAEPVVHVSRTRTPEIVVFGAEARLATPLALPLERDLLVKSLPDGMLEVNRFAAGDDDQRQVCEPKVASLVRTLVAMGATYSDVWMALSEAKRQNALLARLEVDALPRPHRAHQREDASGDAADEGTQEAEPRTWSSNPLPNLFFGRGGEEQEAAPRTVEPPPEEELPPPAEPETGFFGRMTGWFKGD
jgi:hypothetical protein